MTKTVFLSGSRKIDRLNDAIAERVDKMVENGLWIVMGDAGGADTAMQRHLADRQYGNVTVYCSGQSCRNNIGNWDVHHVEVDRGLKGRAFFTAKDLEMARAADIGFVLWDGKSVGSVNNVIELLKTGKIVVVYYAPENRFHDLKTFQDLDRLVKTCPKTDMARVLKETKLKHHLGTLGELNLSD